MEMKLDFSPLGHALAAMSIQCLIGLITGMWGVGGALGCLWYISREHTQAEYRWITQYGAGKRANMPWWGGFDWRVWNLASLLDWLVPLPFCFTLWLLLA
ncbi:hypothetical protein WP5S18E01_22400 [Enterobacter cloacae]|nr:hypothetical protein WP5S18E01_22400 [Enterobacter cloacae]